MKKFLTSNETIYRLMRTVVQGILGVIIANLDTLIGFTPIDPAAKPIIAAVCMAALSPVMAEIGKKSNKEELE